MNWITFAQAVYRSKMPAHTVSFQDGTTESDREKLASLIMSAGGKITQQADDKIDFNIPDDFDLHLITKNLAVETLSDHP